MAENPAKYIHEVRCGHCSGCCTLLLMHQQIMTAKFRLHELALLHTMFRSRCASSLGFLCADDLRTEPGALGGSVRLGDAAQDPRLPQLLEALRASGRKLFLATNSLWDYTHVVMNFLLAGRTGAQKNMDWLEYFDAVITGVAALHALMLAMLRPARQIRCSCAPCTQVLYRRSAHMAA